MKKSVKQAKSSDFQLKAEAGAAPISSLDRAIDVLEAFSEPEPQLTLTEIVGKTGMHKATVFRLLSVLRRRNLVTKEDATGRYRLGMRFMAFTEIVCSRNNFIMLARTAMLELQQETHQTVYLSVRMGDYRFDVEQFIGLNDTRLSIQVGEPKLLEIGAAGRVMLASMPPADVDAYFQRTAKLRLPTTNVALVRQEVEQFRVQGFGESRGRAGLTAVAAPVWGPEACFLGTISIILALDSFEREHVALAAVLRSRVDRLSAELGFLAAPAAGAAH